MNYEPNQDKLDRLDDIVEQIVMIHESEYDCDHDGDKYFQCSRTVSQILEDDYLVLDDDEYDYVETRLLKLERGRMYHV